jgi:penicillin-binding protein 2
MFNPHQFQTTHRTSSPTVSSTRRLRICLIGFPLLLAIVFGRMVQLEVIQGAAFRSEAGRPLTRERSLPGVRGRILARDGTVLAYDKKVLGVAINYRFLEEPPDPDWLRRTARSRLSPNQRKAPRSVAAAEAEVRYQRSETARRLAQLTGTPLDDWNRRARRVQTRVERIVESVNRRRLAEFDRPSGGSESSEVNADASYLQRFRSFAVEILEGSIDESPPQWITVAEELDCHVMAEDLPLEVVVEIEANPELYAGAKIVGKRRRVYPAGRLAAHLLGHLGPVDGDGLSGLRGTDKYHPDDRVGRMGLERQYEDLLRGRRGVAVELSDRRGRLLSSHRRTEPGIGRDLVLTIDSRLQRAAEELLESALERRTIRQTDAEPAGGAIVVMDVHGGAILAAASAPGFDPNLFAAGDDAGQIEALFSDPDHPMFDRTCKMAIPPGSVFKIVSAAAILESSALSPGETFFCQGYLHSPDRQRCTIYKHHGIGHGDVTLSDALCVSCNVYFFHQAERLGWMPLVDWSLAFGLAQPTGVDLPDEAAGMVPTPATIRQLEGHGWRPGDTESLAIGQGSLQATPLQVVRMMAAVANGGYLVTPHLVSRLGLPELSDEQSTADLSAMPDDPIRISPPRSIPGLKPSTLAAIREGLDRVVSDPDGTAHGTALVESVAIAGKTGTAETGEDRAEHAWFAGYVPADRPELAFVVALEHSGNAAEAACPVAKRLVLRMRELGYVVSRRE